MQLSQEKLNEKNRAKILKSLAFAEVRFKPKNGNCNDVTKDIEKMSKRRRSNQSIRCPKDLKFHAGMVY